MVAYRGISQEGVINSLIGACALVQRNSPGPACDHEIDAFLSAIPDLQKASTDKELEAVMWSPAFRNLIRMRPLFQEYFEKDTDGVGRNVMNALKALGVFGGTEQTNSTALDYEIHSYRASQLKSPRF